MGLDAYVRCRCIQDGLAKAHPLATRLFLDEAAEPGLKDDPNLKEWLLHDRWFADSCQHGGYLVSERLGNISTIAHVRELVRHLQRESGPQFPILLGHVIYNGSHSGDWLPISQVEPLLEEVQIVLRSADILSDTEKEFFETLRRLCDASIATGNPIMF